MSRWIILLILFLAAAAGAFIVYNLTWHGGASIDGDEVSNIVYLVAHSAP